MRVWRSSYFVDLLWRSSQLDSLVDWILDMRSTMESRFFKHFSCRNCSHWDAESCGWSRFKRHSQEFSLHAFNLTSNYTTMWGWSVVKHRNEQFRNKVWARDIILRIIIYQEYLKPSCDRIRITKGENVYREGNGMKGKRREKRKTESGKTTEKGEIEPRHSTLKWLGKGEKFSKKPRRRNQWGSKCSESRVWCSEHQNKKRYQNIGSRESNIVNASDKYDENAARYRPFSILGQVLQLNGGDKSTVRWECV